jgi:hypothetical protein
MGSGWLLAVALAVLALAQAHSNCPVEYPRQHVAYHLGAGQSISIDGRLDDPAWAEVGWSEPFMDIQGAWRSGLSPFQA